MNNILKNYIKNSGTYTDDLNGNVMINVPDVTQKDMTITGDLVIGVVWLILLRLLEIPR